MPLPQQKLYTSSPRLKADKPGTFSCVFARLNVIDFDQEVSLPATFESGARVKIMGYSHDWSEPPIGLGTIRVQGNEAICDGELFLDTPRGRETYDVFKAIQAAGHEQEFSYGFSVDQAHFGDFQGQQVRFLDRVTVHEVSPVLKGAGVNTMLLALKSAKAGARNSASDMATMGELRDHLSAAVDLIDELMRTDEPKQRQRGPSASPYALRIAAELLDLGADLPAPKQSSGPDSAFGLRIAAELLALS